MRPMSRQRAFLVDARDAKVQQLALVDPPKSRRVRRRTCLYAFKLHGPVCTRIWREPTEIEFKIHL